MNTPPLINPVPIRRGNLILTLLGLTLVLGFTFIAVVVLGVMSYVHLGSDARALRNSLSRTASIPWKKTVEVNIGSFTTSLARVGLEFAHLDHDARLALQAVRSGEVGVYELAKGSKPDPAKLLPSADAVMDKRGWDRLVGVSEPGTLVAIYVRRTAPSSGDLQFCFAVFAEEHVVIGSARGDLAPLVELAMAKHPWQTDLPAKIKL